MSFKGYDQADQVGQAGIESTYERWLQGTKGVVKYRVEAAAGHNLGDRKPGSRSPATTWS